MSPYNVEKLLEEFWQKVAEETYYSVEPYNVEKFLAKKKRLIEEYREKIVDGIGD